MNFFERIGNGWSLALLSFDIIKKNKSLLVFPALSVLSILLIILSFMIGSLILSFGEWAPGGSIFFWLLIFYFVNSAVVIFFNMALIHCTFKILNGEQASVVEGVRFSFSRIKLVLSWALLSASVGVVLKAIERKHKILTNIVSGMFGLLWSLATFLVIPVLAYENLNVTDAIKRSAFLFNRTWGEQAGATFSFGVIGFLVFCALGIFLGAVILPLNIPVFFILLIFSGSVIGCVMSAAETVFLAATYQYAARIPVKGFDQEGLKNIFSSAI